MTCCLLREKYMRMAWCRSIVHQVVNLKVRAVRTVSLAQVNMSPMLFRSLLTLSTYQLGSVFPQEESDHTQGQTWRECHCMQNEPQSELCRDGQSVSLQVSQVFEVLCLTATGFEAAKTCWDVWTKCLKRRKGVQS